jgi:hypothetical protein
MTGVSRIATTAAPQAQAQPTRGAPASILPTPEMSDPMAALYAVMLKQRQQGRKGSITNLRGAQNTRRRMIQLRKDEIARAVRAARKGRFWKNLANTCFKLAKYAAVAGSIALAIGSAGAATPIAVLAISGAALSTAAFAQGETHYLQKLGISDKWAERIELGMYLGSAACSAFGGVAQLCAGTTSKMQAGWAIAGASTGGASGLANGGGAIAMWQAGEAEADGIDHVAEAVRLQAEEARMQRLIQQILEDIEGSEESDQRTLEHVSGTMISRGEALTMISTRV